MLRTDELAELAPDVTTAFVVENEVTYLAFPELADSIVVFGSGFALTTLGDLPWLQDTEIVYWGDIDTHGLDVLNRLRRSSMQVDAHSTPDTLLAHAEQWVVEPAPTSRALPYLTADEASLYRDLVEGLHGQSIRLEQERVRFWSASGPFVHQTWGRHTSRLTPGPERVMDRMDHEQFFAARRPRRAAAKKALWNLYWRGTATVRQRIEAELEPDGPRPRRKEPEPTDPDGTLDAVCGWFAFARSGAYLAGDRRVSPHDAHVGASPSSGSSGTLS